MLGDGGVIVTTSSMVRPLLLRSSAVAGDLTQAHACLLPAV